MEIISSVAVCLTTLYLVLIILKRCRGKKSSRGMEVSGGYVDQTNGNEFLLALNQTELQTQN